MIHNHQQNHHNWANNLPLDIWELIKTHINSRIDVFRFRSVCKSWRSLLPLSHLQSSTTPLRLLRPPSSSSSTTSDIVDLAFLYPATICRLEQEQKPSVGFLTKVEESPQGKLQLLIPLSTHKFYINPCNNNNSGKTLNMLNFRLVELAKSYTPKSLITRSPIEGVVKVLMFNHADKNDNNNIRLLCIFGEGKLGHWSPGDKKWTLLNQQNTLLYDDIVLYKGQYYAVDKSGTVWWINNMTLELLQYSPQLYLIGDKKSLVESETMLYMVDRYIGDDNKRVCDMRVYRLDEEWGTWVHVSSLGDRLFVLGNDCCFSASAMELAGCCTVMYQNCVFYTDSCDERFGINGGISGYCTRVFRLDDRRTWRVASSSNHICVFSPPLEWLNCSLLEQ